MWDGVERRTNVMRCPVDCRLEEAVMQASKDIVELRGEVKTLNVRINGSLDKISNFMESGIWWRRTIVGVVITVLLQATGGFVVATQLAESFGQNKRQIDVNTHRLDVLEQTRINGGSK